MDSKNLSTSDKAFYQGALYGDDLTRIFGKYLALRLFFKVDYKYSEE